MNTIIAVYLKNKLYITSNGDNFHEHVESEIKKLINNYLLYKNYIKDHLKFLNNKNSYSKELGMKYKWERHGAYNRNNNNSVLYRVYLYDSDEIVCKRERSEIMELSRKINEMDIKNLKKNSVEFKEFLNRRFCLDKIWQKYKVPSCLSKWIEENYF